MDRVRGFRQDAVLVIVGSWLAAACGLTPPVGASATPPTSATSTDRAVPSTAAGPGTPTPWIAGTEAVDQAQSWITVVGRSVTFECPESWDPVRDAPADDIHDSWRLAIPQGEIASIGFAGAGLERFRPPEALVIRESHIRIGGKPGFKWLRRTEIGGETVVYEYFTTGLHDEGVFSLSVLLPGPDQDLERRMDRVIQSVVFTEGP